MHSPHSPLDVFIDPVHVLADPYINARQVRLGTADAVGDDSDQDPGGLLLGPDHEGAA